MKLYNLRWNPKISSFTTQQFLNGFPLLNKENSQGIGTDWSVREYENVEVGDWWILSRVGGDNNGIVGIGQFLSIPEADKSWRNDGSMIYYADILVLCFQQPEKTGILKADDLKRVVPEIDWDKGSSGVLIEEKIAEKLAFFIAENLLSLGEDNCNNDNIALRAGNGGCWSLVCALLSQLCPGILQELQKTQVAIPATEYWRVPDYLDEIVYDLNALKSGKLLKDSLILLSWENIYPIDDIDDIDLSDFYE
jgi:hypothetical protein